MIFAPHHRLVCITPWKCGSTSLRAALGGISVPLDWFHQHTSAEAARAVLENWDTLFKTAWIRNPWTWWESWYRYVIDQPYHREHLLVCSYRDFRHFILRGVIGRQFGEATRDLRSFVCDRSGRLIVDWIGRVEFLNQDFRNLRQRLGLPASTCPDPRWLNPSSHAVKTEFDPETTAAIAQHHAADIELFGFVPGGYAEDKGPIIIREVTHG